MRTTFFDFWFKPFQSCRGRLKSAESARNSQLSLSAHVAATLIQAFVSCRLDNCNSLLYGVSDGLIRKLWSTQNSAARFITCVRRCDRITHVLRQWHWHHVRRTRHFSAQCDTQQDAQLSQRDRAAGCVIVFAKSRKLEVVDYILRTL